MVQARETRVTQWGPSLGIRLPKEFAEQIGLKNKSMARVELKNGIIQIMPISEQRRHIPLAERMGKALDDGTWDGKPAEITQEDSEWLDMPSVGEEIPW